MKPKKLLAMVLVLSSFFIFISGTGNTAYGEEEYIYVSCMGNLEFFNAHKYGWKWAGKTLGVKTTYVGPAEYDLNAMVAAFDQAIAKKPKGIVVFAVEPVLVPSINKAVDAGIRAQGLDPDPHEKWLRQLVGV